ASCSLPACEVCGPAGFGSAVVQSLGCVRPRCTPRWYADNNPRTASGVRRWLLLAALSTPPGTNCAMGTRFGRPAAVVSVTGTSAAAEAARQPSSAAVCQCEVESRRGAESPAAPAPAPPGPVGMLIIDVLPVVVPVPSCSAPAGAGHSWVSRPPDADRSPSTLAVEDAGPSGPARLVRNQADSSSWKIGSSIVSSTKGAAGGSAGAVVAAGPAGAPATVSSP